MREPEAFIDKGLAAKGIGPKGLKPMGRDDIEGVVEEIASGDLHEALSATFVMAFQVLERDQQEVAYLKQAFEGRRGRLSSELQFLFEIFSSEPTSEIESVLFKLAQREDLSERECQFGVDYLLDKSQPDSYKAAYLQGLRVKRESDAENLALFSQLFKKAPRLDLEGTHEVLVDWSDPYDGMNRHPNLSFLSALVLSAFQVPVVIHSCRSLGPKYGKTVLDHFEPSEKFGLQYAEQAMDELGLAVLDQELVFPELSSLKVLRNEMRKRPFLATVEKMLMPLRSRNFNLLVTGYVHKAYKEAIPKMVIAHGAFSSIYLTKGIEGSVLLDPSKKIPYVLEGSETNEVGELCLENRGESPKGDLEDDDIQRVLTEDHPYWGCIQFTVSKILEKGLGRSCESDIITEMARLKNEGMLFDRYKKIKSFYSSSGGHA